MAVSTSQIMTRLPIDERAEYEAIAALNDINLSELMRKSLELAKDEFRQQGEELARRRNELPHGVTQRMEDEAFESLIISLNNGEQISFRLRDVLTPQSKALFRLLGIVWNEQPSEVSQKAIDKFAQKANEIIAANPQATNQKPGRDIKSRSRKEL